MEMETTRKIHAIIDKILNLIEKINNNEAKNVEVSRLFSDSINEVYLYLDKNTSEYNRFDNWKITNYNTIWTSERDKNKQASSHKGLTDLLCILQEITSYKKIDSEVHFTASDEFKARQYFRKLFRSAKEEIFIIDNYLSSIVFEFLEDIYEDINIRFLASKEGVKVGFKNDFLSCKRKNTECRLHVSANHDRYILIDNSELYNPGTTLNGIGKNDFTVKKLEGGEKIQYLEDLWKDSQILN